VPYYNRPPQEGLRAHFGAIAASTPLPVMLYNVPGRTAANLLPATLGAIAAEHANVVAIKEASPDLEQAAEIVRTLPSPFLLYSGDDARTLPLMALGGYGVVSVASQLVPERMAALVAAAAEGRIEAARRLHLELTPLFRALFITTNPIPVKVMLGLAGFPVGGFRLPLCAPGAAELEQLRAAVDRYRLAASFA
jgi:4-hydroxy-tetrahydrodipicolinate synthase